MEDHHMVVEEEEEEERGRRTRNLREERPVEEKKCLRKLTSHSGGNPLSSNRFEGTVGGWNATCCNGGCVTGCGSIASRKQQMLTKKKNLKR